MGETNKGQEENVRMPKYFISVLGTGGWKKKYDVANYAYESQVCETEYIQEALCSFFMKEIESEDRALILVTKESKETHFSILQGILIRKYHFQEDQVIAVEIPSGKNEDELMQIFEAVSENIPEEARLVVDVTHGFRTLPMMLLSVVCFLRAVKHVSVDGIYYGAFEARDEANGLTPVINLMPFLDIIEWTQAARAFVDYGVSDQIFQLFQVII